MRLYHIPIDCDSGDFSVLYIPFCVYSPKDLSRCILTRYYELEHTLSGCYTFLSNERGNPPQAPHYTLTM